MRFADPACGIKMTAMKTTFKVREKEYTVELSKKERTEEDKFNPYAAKVSGQVGGDVQGLIQVTDAAIEMAGEKAASGGGSEGDLLAKACGRSLASEILIRKLKPEFSFVVDYRWL